MMKTEKILLLSVISMKIILVLGVFFLFGEDRFIWADTQHYASIGRNLVMGHGLSFPGSAPGTFSPTTEFMPLYPALLGFFSLWVSHGFTALSLLQAVAAGFTALFFFFLREKVFSRFFFAAAAPRCFFF